MYEHLYSDVTSIVRPGEVGRTIQCPILRVVSSRSFIFPKVMCSIANVCEVDFVELIKQSKWREGGNNGDDLE